jgi:hypothetical protein
MEQLYYKKTTFLPMMTLKYRKNKNLNRGNTQELKQRRMLIDFSLQFLQKNLTGWVRLL